MRRARVRGMDYDDKAKSKREAKDALRALREAERYLEEITKFNAEIQITRTEFDALVVELRGAQREMHGWRALALTFLDNEFVPVSVFRVWASYAVIRLWSRKPQDPLETRRLNGKLTCRPGDFFRALHRHGDASRPPPKGETPSA